jgi:hypothetical protein
MSDRATAVSETMRQRRKLAKPTKRAAAGSAADAGAPIFATLLLLTRGT